MTLVEKEISNFKFIIMGEEYINRLKEEKVDEGLRSELRKFIDKFEVEVDLKDNLISDIHQKLTTVINIDL